ncbi:saccharopine dehydrogenase NADP-binding domain-containing protein [Neptuniibacter sp. QD34_54]|uniref:saccharopine dehydrogenase NADP-binding domain-containing protein n=1 Tax=Neptuniibacter sp. QD34_54 TaxID=3398208 RepID=UPI0039F60ACF
MDLKDKQSTKKQPYPILVIGGYGNFGKKITETLAKEANIRVIIAGRNEGKAEALAKQLSTTAINPLKTLALDINSADISDQLSISTAKLVIHTSGPFQAQGYNVAEACIDAGIHYIDLADGRLFVEGFESLNDQAQQQSVIAITGASSVPGLSSAVIEHYKSRFKVLQELNYGIAPGNQTERGEATVKAILSYSGLNFKRWRDNRWQDVRGWQNTHRHKFPSPIGSRWLANCDIPDLTLFQQRYPGLESIRFYAGLELSFLHLGLWSLSYLPRFKFIKNLARYSRPLTLISTWVQQLGSDVGGMYMELKGLNHKNEPQRIIWNLIAESGDGPYIPTIASIILAKKIAKGQLSETGAQACVGLFTLEEFTKEVENWDIHQQVLEND